MRQMIFFENLLGTGVVRQFGLNLDSLNIGTLDLSSLEVDFTSEEVWEAIKSLPQDRVMGQTVLLENSILLAGRLFVGMLWTAFRR